jgi:hypothetical protein
VGFRRYSLSLEAGLAAPWREERNAPPPFARPLIKNIKYIVEYHYHALSFFLKRGIIVG